MAFKTLIFFGLVALTLGFTLPAQVDGDLKREYFEYPVEDGGVLIRRVRSPQGKFEGKFSHSNQHGSSASVDYVHPINKNWEVYAGGSRDFKDNDNSAHAGLAFKF